MKGQPFNGAVQQPIRTFLSALSATGFNDYELGRKTVALNSFPHVVLIPSFSAE